MAKIEVFMRPGCGYCHRAKALLGAKDLPFVEYDIWTDRAANADLHRRLPHSKTVPQIFIDGQSIGGCDELLKLDAEGRLTVIASAR